MFELNLNLLLAARTHTATNKDLRLMLQGVRLDFRAGKMIATDGHRIFLACIEKQDEDAVTVPNELLDNLQKIVKASKLKAGEKTSVELEIVGDALKFTFNCASVLGFKGEKQFPDYFRVIPASVSGEPAQYQTKYAFEATKALRLAVNADKADFNLVHNGDSCGIMSTVDHDGQPIIIGIMPLRSQHTGSNAQNVLAANERLDQVLGIKKIEEPKQADAA